MKKIKIIMWFIWLALIVLWNYGYPNASPFFDVLMAFILSILNILVLRIIRSNILTLRVTKNKS